MKVWTVIKMAWRSLLRNRRRTIITLSAITFGLSLAVFFLSMAEGVYQQMINDAVRMQGGNFALEHREYRDAPAVDLFVGNAEGMRGELSAIEGVERVKGFILGQGVVKTGSGAVGVAVFGVEPSAEAETSPLAKKIVEGEFLADGDGRKVVIGAKLAKRLRSKVGKKLVVATNNADGDLVEELVRVKGIFSVGVEDIDGYVVQVPVSFARGLYNLEAGAVTQLGVVLADADSRDDVLEAAAPILQRTDAVVRLWEEIQPDLAAYVRVDRSSNIVFQAIIIFLSLFTIFNTILMSVLERTREFAMQLALGAPGWLLRTQIAVESVMLGMLGSAIGLLLGGAAGWHYQINGLDMSSLYKDGVEVSGIAINTLVHFKVSADILLVLGTLVFVATLIMSLIAMRQIGRVRVADVLR